jgi:D-lactate dehydrogenase
MSKSSLIPATVRAATPELEALHARLREAVADPARVQTRPIDLVAYASDASFYHLLPQAVVHPVDVDEVQRVVRVGRDLGVAVTFRAAGTSLSGQAVTDGILVVLARAWQGIEAVDGGARVRVQPGVIGAHVNRYLEPFGRRIGPDPASIDSCMMGGILANNASGMCCGVVENAYHTIVTAKILLADGTVVDTAAPDAAATLEREAPRLVEGLRRLRADVLADPALVERIRGKYRQKNTTGYSLNALIDHQEPIDILPRVLIGSEGTLAFIAEATLETLPTYPFKTTSFMLFDSALQAAAATRVLAASGARAVEFFDRASLAAVDDVARELLGDDVVFHERSSALLVEYQVGTAEELEALRPAIAAAVGSLDLARPAEFTQDAARQALIWKARKGLYPAVGAVRAAETAVIIEDVAVALDRLPECVDGLQQLFERHGYGGSIIFGHAKDGNLHFVITQRFDDDAARDRYAAFMDDLVELIVGQLDGALKAEHGTGRNIAPFVETEWGPEAYAVMRRLKEIFDPDGVLNPGVLISDNPRGHLEHLKHLPSAAPEVDACVECGFCEKVCPSVDLTLSPRRRIAVLRHVERLRQARPHANGDGPTIDRTIDSLLADYLYDGLDTCAADGLCSTACPVGIDTGRLVKRLRDERHGAAPHRLARWIVDHAATTESLIRLALHTAHGLERVLGAGAVRGSVTLARKLTGLQLPAWVPSQPRPPRTLGFMTDTPPSTVDVIVFPTCVSRIMGRPRGRERSQTEVLLDLCKRAGVGAWAPASLGGGCCGLAMASKGHADASRRMLVDLVGRLHDVSDGGRLPVVIDASSCTHAALEDGAKLAGADRERWEALDLVDVTTFARDTLLPRLQLDPLAGVTFVHPNCALRLMGGDAALVACVEAASAETVVPENLACCATAGDRGLIFPELSASALRRENKDFAAADARRSVSSNLSCETGLGAQTGGRFESFLYLLEEASRRGG